MNADSEAAPRTVLVVDEDLKTALNCKSEFESKGYRVMCTHSGREALELFAREKIDLIVSEVSLPDMPGMELIEAFAARRQRVPIVVNTTALGYKESFRSWAADAVVEKSNDICALFAMVTALLQPANLVH